VTLFRACSGNRKSGLTASAFTEARPTHAHDPAYRPTLQNWRLIGSEAQQNKPTPGP
jgi:hypothetical protein